MASTNIPAEIASIATAALVCDASAAQEMLEMMVSQRPFIASSLATYNPLNGTHQTLASVGYDHRVLSHLNDWLVTDDIAYQYYRVQGHRQKALKWAEMPFNYKDTYSVQNVYLPAGFREGITLRLHTRDGRYTGNLHISTDDRRFPTKEMMTNDIQCLQTILGNFTDILRRVSGRFMTKVAGSSGCLMTLYGEVIGLPGVAPIEHLLRDTLVAQLRSLDQDQVPEVFLFKHDSVWFRIHTGLLEGSTRAVVAERCQPPHGLTERELEIVELLISGASNNQIASSIFVARTTVAKHLESIFDKLGCNSRTSVVRIALSSHLRRLPTRRRPLYL